MTIYQRVIAQVSCKTTSTGSFSIIIIIIIDKIKPVQTIIFSCIQNSIKTYASVCTLLKAHDSAVVVTLNRFLTIAFTHRIA